MPCKDYEDLRFVRDEKLRRENAMLEASLCAILTSLEKKNEIRTFLNDVDWKEAGVPASTLFSWWVNHKEQDAKRRACEEAERAKKEARQAALAKLTPEERKALGLKD